jgi:vacuolar-type H+-ATPase subunit F/Vma7
LLEDFKNIFLKSYSPLEDIKKFLKQEKNMDLAIVNEDLIENLEGKTNNIVDILII